MSRRVVIIIIASILLIGVVIVVILFTRQTSQKELSTTPDTESVSTSLLDSSTIPFRITNFSVYSDSIDGDTQYNIENTIYFNSKDAAKGTYTGIIRKGSYQTSTDGSISRITFLVDIESIKQSYAVSIGDDTETGEHSVYVTCPTKEQLIYPAFNCKDYQE